MSGRSAATPSATARTHRLAERGSHHAANLTALLGVHEKGVEALGFDHGVRERVNRCWWLRDDPLLVLRRQAVAKPHTEISLEAWPRPQRER
jgi:hypothetical protein